MNKYIDIYGYIYHILYYIPMGSFQGKFGVFATMNTMLFFLLGLTSRNHALPPIIEQNYPFIGVDNQLFDFIILTPLLILQSHFFITYTNFTILVPQSTIYNEVHDVIKS